LVLPWPTFSVLKNEKAATYSITQVLKRIQEDKDIFIGTSKFDGKGKLLELRVRDL